MNIILQVKVETGAAAQGAKEGREDATSRRADSDAIEAEQSSSFQMMGEQIEKPAPPAWAAGWAAAHPPPPASTDPEAAAHPEAGSSHPGQIFFQVAIILQAYGLLRVERPGG